MSKNKIIGIFIIYIVIIFIIVFFMELHNIDAFNILDPWLYHGIGIMMLVLATLFTFMKVQKEISEYYQSANQELINSKIALDATNNELEATNQELQATEEELRATNDKLEQQKQDLDILFYTIPEGIIRTDEKGKVLFCNKLILEGAGLRREDLVNKDIENIVWPEDRPMFAEEFSKVFLQGRVKELSFQNLKGTQLLTDITLLKDNKNHTIGTLSAIRDFAKTSKIIEELDNSRKELRQKIEEMQLLHRTTIDREKRIIELKEQVETLKQEIAKGQGAQTV